MRWRAISSLSARKSQLSIGRSMKAHGFNSMGDQMDAIVKATETATNNIMEAMETSEGAVEKLREQPVDADQIALLNTITDSSNNVFEACSFQDITGQRVNKIAKSVTYVEERVNKLID